MCLIERREREGNGFLCNGQQCHLFAKLPRTSRSASQSSPGVTFDQSICRSVRSVRVPLRVCARSRSVESCLLVLDLHARLRPLLAPIGHAERMERKRELSGTDRLCARARLRGREKAPQTSSKDVAGGLSTRVRSKVRVTLAW